MSAHKMSVVRRMGARKEDQRHATGRNPVNVNHVLILSNPLTSYHRPRPPLAKLCCKLEARHGREVWAIK